MSKKKIPLQPLGARVVVRPFTEEEKTKTASGIILPESKSAEKPEQGEVVAVGEGEVLADGSRRPIAVSVGDRVVFAKYGPEEVTIDEETYLIIKEDSLLAVISS